MARYRDAALRERGVKELPVAALLAPQHPSFRVQSLQHIANFHNASLARPIAGVKAQRPA
jgi:hypothetical protein